MNSDNQKVLVIERSTEYSKEIKNELEKIGFVVDLAFDGLAGFKKIKDFKPDLILMDLVLPELDGYDLLEKLKEENNLIPVMIVTEISNDISIEKTKKLGVVDYIVKSEKEIVDIARIIKQYFNVGAGEYEGLEMVKLKKQESFFGKKLGIKIMVVEDYKSLRDALSKKLVKEGYIVYSAANGEEALGGISDAEPDVILLDIMMPGISGFEVISRLRKSPSAKISRIPIIVLSNVGGEEDINKAMMLGADDFMVKANYTIEQIIEKIKDLKKH